MLLLANFVAAIPAYYRIMLIVCTLPNQAPCAMIGSGAPSGQLTPDNVHALAQLHLCVANYVTLQVVVSLLYCGVGLLIFWRKSDEGMGLFVSLWIVLYGASSVTNTFLFAYLTTQPPLILLALISVAQWAGLGVFLLTFPTGRFVPRWSWLLILPWVITSVWNPSSPVLLVAISLLTFGSALGIAILRYRLWDIDIIINRTLVYGSLTAILALLYVGLIFALQSLLGTITKQSNNDVAIVVSTLAIAALFQPLRHGIHRSSIAASTAASMTLFARWRSLVPPYAMKWTCSSCGRVWWQWTRRRCSLPMSPCGCVSPAGPKLPHFSQQASPRRSRGYLSRSKGMGYKCFHSLVQLYQRGYAKSFLQQLRRFI